MSINIHILAASKEIRPYAKELKSKAIKAIKKINKFFPLTDIDIVFNHHPEGAIREIGIGGMTTNANTVFISLDPRHPNFKRAISKKLFSTLAHEFHHAIRWRKPGYGRTFFEQLVTEGLAVHFEMEVEGTKKSPLWAHALTPKQKAHLWKRAKRIWHRPSFSFRDGRAWFSGSKKRRIPRWTGYTLGFDLISAYLKDHPKIKPSTLVTSPPDIFIPKM